MVYFVTAFDSVCHRCLHATLESFGLSEKGVQWLRSYHAEGTYRLQVADASSQEIGMKSGIPKGSGIGQLLFLMFANDLPSDLPSM